MKRYELSLIWFKCCFIEKIKSMYLCWKMCWKSPCASTPFHLSRLKFNFQNFCSYVFLQFFFIAWSIPSWVMWLKSMNYSCLVWLKLWSFVALAVNNLCKASHWLQWCCFNLTLLCLVILQYAHSSFRGFLVQKWPNRPDLLISLWMPVVLGTDLSKFTIKFSLVEPYFTCRKTWC